MANHLFRFLFHFVSHLNTRQEPRAVRAAQEHFHRNGSKMLCASEVGLGQRIAVETFLVTRVCRI